MRVTFFIEYHTRWGQQLFLSGGIEALGSGNEERALPMQYVDDGWWDGQRSMPMKGVHLLTGICCAENGVCLKEWGWGTLFPPHFRHFYLSGL